MRLQIKIGDDGASDIARIGDGLALLEPGAPALGDVARGPRFGE